MNPISRWLEKRREHKRWKRNYEAEKTRAMLEASKRYHEREMDERTRRT